MLHFFVQIQKFNYIIALLSFEIIIQLNYTTTAAIFLHVGILKSLQLNVCIENEN